MTATLVHRGPDAGGLWADPQGRCVLGHRRLSIIDTSDAGRQPMATPDGRFVISYNGEIYNYLSIRAELEAAGVRFCGRTDTEVLLQAFATWGVEAFKRLDGMFALAFFDTHSGELSLIRDAFGEKPLYYSKLGDGTLVFGSELQALEQVPGIDLRVSIDAMAEVLSFQYIGAPRTIYESVKKLRPGHWLRISPDGRTQTGRYFSFRPGASGFSDRPIGDLADELEDILIRSVERRMIADVPLGAFLSGGVDSSTVCALIRRRLNRPLMTFSIGFEGAPESEHLVARKFGQHLGTSHFDQILTPDAAEFLFDFGKILDEPNADSSCLPTNLLAAFARERVTVAISGDGGDEMFGGYGRYLNNLAQLQQYGAGELAGWKPGSAYYGNQVLVASEPHIEELFGFVPQGYADHVGLLRTELDERQDQLLAAMRRSDVDNYMPGAVLPKVDRMSMQHSLEVRTPFLNMEVARFAERLPESVLVDGGRGKLILKEISYRYLPRELVDLPKQGFALPMSDWAKGSLLKIGKQMLEADESRLRAVVGQAGIGRFMARQESPGNFSPYQLWGVVALESWLRHHPAQLPSIDQSASPKPRSKATNDAARELVAAPLGSKIYVVERTNEEGDHNDSDHLPVELKQRALQLLATSSQVGEPESATVRRLGDWSSPPAKDGESGDLAGAVLLFADRDAALHMDYHEIERFRSLGVNRLVARNPYVDAELQEITLNGDQSWMRRLKLSRDRAAWLSRFSALQAFGAKRLRLRRGHAWQSSLLRSVDPFPDVEMSDKFMVFEGSRQLPPLTAAHDLIAERGGGRYSVFDQVLTLSPTAPGRERFPYTLIRRTERNSANFPTTLDRWKHESPSSAELADALETLVRRGGAGSSLKAGDPIVVCTHSLPPGGAERQWVYLAQAMSQAGFNVSFVTFRGVEGVSGHYLAALHEAGLRHVDASAFKAVDQLRSWPRTREALRLFGHPLVPDHEAVARLVTAFAQIRPAAVLTQLDDPNVIGGLAAQIAGVPLHVMSFRNYNPSNFPYIAKDWYRGAYEALCRSPRVLLSGNHRDANRDYADWIGVDPGRVAYIPNAIDAESFRRADDDQIEKARAELNLPADAPVILGVTRLSAEKDPETFLEVCGRVLAARPDAYAFLAGVGPLRAQLEEQIERHGLAGRVRLLGRRSDIDVLMSLADVFLLTSRYEGMPNVVLEAQSVGVPTVVTDAGASGELVQDGHSGFVRPVGDVEGLVASCIRLLSDPARAAEMGRRGSSIVRTRNSKEQLAAGYVDLLRSAMPETGEDFIQDQADQLGAIVSKRRATNAR